MQRNSDEGLICVAALARQWPETLATLPYRYIFALLHDADAIPEQHERRFETLFALLQAHWRPNDVFVDGGFIWLDLSRQLLERGDSVNAGMALARLNSPYDIITATSDRRFDRLVAANPAAFDVEAATDRQLAELRIKVAAAPDRLGGVIVLCDALIARNLNDEALALLDGAIARARPADGSASPFTDTNEQYNWALDMRARLLLNVNRVDEALAAMERGARQPEDGQVNVSQIINLGDFYFQLARPTDALAQLELFDPSGASPYGRMSANEVRVCAYAQLGDAAHMNEALTYMRAHKADGLTVLREAELCANNLDAAAQLLIDALNDPSTRGDALLNIQTFADPPFVPPYGAELDRRKRAMIARGDVQAVIRRLGRVGAYPRLAEPLT